MGRRLEEIKQNNGVQAVFGFVASLSFGATLSVSAGEGRTVVAYSNSFLSVFFGLLCGICFVQAGKRLEEDRLRKIVSLLFAVGLSLALILGKKLETVENIRVTDAAMWLNVVILALFLRPFISFAWQRMAEWGRWEAVSCLKKMEGDCWIKEKLFWRNLILIFACWLPVFLAFYPGAFVYDATDEYVQVATRTFTTHHPLIHVLLLGGFVTAGNKFFGSFNLGIAAYTLFQMAVLAAVFSYTLLWISRRINEKKTERLLLLFYCFFPVIPMYAVCSAKDAFFTAALLVVLTQMLTLFENPESFLVKKGNLAASILAAAVMMLFRNNGCYAYAVWSVLCVAALFFLSKNTEKGRQLCFRGAFMMLAGIALFLAVSGGLAWGLKAEKGGSQEILTVPIQQLARTWKYSPEVYEEEDKELLFSLLSEEDLKTYNPRISDIIKSKFNNIKLNQNKINFLSLWIKIGLRKPMSYLNAWLMTSYGFWYPDAVINVYGGNRVHTFTYEESSYFGFETEYPGTRESKLPWLEEQYRKMSLEIYQQRVPAVSMLFSPGYQFWMFAFCMGFLICQRSLRRIIPLLLILLVWMTVLLGPTYLVRYVLILWFAMPIIVSSTKVWYTNTIAKEQKIRNRD